MTLALLIAAAVATCLAIAGQRSLVRREDALTLAWVFLIAAWPFIAIYFVNPLIWATADEAGVLNPGVQYLPPALCSLVVTIAGLRADRVEVSLPAVMIGSLYLFVAVSMWFSGFPQVFHFVLSATMFSAVIFKRGLTKIETLSVAARLSLAAILVAIAISALINSGRVLADCRVDKCGFMPVVFTSPFAGNGNVLGMVTVLLVPFACATLPLSRSILLLGGVAAMQVVAVSRTAMFAFAVVGAAVVLIKMSASLLWRLRFAYVAFVVGLCASFYPLFVKFSGGSFSLRGYVWEAGREAIRQAPVFGHGPNYWHLLADNALFEPNYSPHNGWYDLVVAVGLWGVVVIAAAVAVQLYSTRKEILPYLVTYYACVLAINMFESVYVPYHFVIIPFAALLPLMLYDPKPADDEEMERNFVAFKRTRTG
jgi:hypothetical protein